MDDRQTVLTLVQSIPAAIITEDDAGRASEKLAEIRKTRKQFEAKFDELKRPFNDGLKQLNTEFKSVIDPLKDAEAKLSSGILGWRQKIEAEAARVRAEEERRQREYEAAQRAAAVANKPAPMPPPTVPAAKVEGPGRGFATGAGTVTARKIPKWRVTDDKQIPYEIVVDGETVRCWMLDETAIGKLCRSKGGKDSPIPGIEFYQEETLGVR